MNCREAEKLLDLFLDGELEARPMRTVALHVTRCPTCEHVLQQRERLQDLVSEVFTDAMAEVDFSTLWPSVALRMDDVRPRWFRRARAVAERVRELGHSPTFTVATAAAVAVLAAVLVWRGFPASAESPVLHANNQVRIDSLMAETRSVALLSEPESNTTVIWVVEDGGTP
jgi:anti-sigma factor RsiW